MVLAIWFYLVAARGGFWAAGPRDDDSPPWDGSSSGGSWPNVVAVVPARDEADCVGTAVASLLAQAYQGAFTVVLVDDQSRDGTAQVAREAAAAAGAADRLTVLSGRPLPAGWTGKLWAQQQGVELAENLAQPPVYLLFTDADIVYAPDALANLVARAQSGGTVLTSLMAKLRCKSFAERMFVPAFIFFFQMLYPFAWANNPRRATAAAAGGCMLVRRDALREAGGMAAIRDALIDDCALAKQLKARGPIWIGLTERVHSIRAYPEIADIRRMVSRTAYAQLRYSPLLLAGTVFGSCHHLFGAGGPRDLRDRRAAIRRYLRVAADGVRLQADLAVLPVVAGCGRWRCRPLPPCYMAFTIDSAYQHARGRGGMWKGRAQANISDTR